MAKKSDQKILVTGGAGFIGSEFTRQAVKRGYRPVIVDKITYAGDLARLREVKDKIDFYKVDICDLKKLDYVFKKHAPDSVVHFAAETHVDRSLLNIRPFNRTNIKGTKVLSGLSVKYNVKKFIHISTDEVYGGNDNGMPMKEGALLNPSNPYSGTKAMSEVVITEAKIKNFLPEVIIRPSNCYGPWQHPEKFIPLIISKAINNNKVPVYGKGSQIREWLYVKDCVEGVFTVLKKGKIGEIYNLGSSFEQDNITTVKTILKKLKKPAALIKFVKDRYGHDFRYSIDCKKVKRLGWMPKYSFDEGLKQTILWNLDNIAWLKGKIKEIKPYWKTIYKG